MARPAGGTVHIGKAAALIVAAVLIGLLVLYQDGGTSGGLSESELRALTNDALTTTTLDPDLGGSTDTTDASSVRSPAEVKVIAINATNKAGVAGRATTRLTTGGYNALAPGNATSAYKATNAATAVFVVTAGYEAEAASVAALFGLPSSSVRALPTPSPSTDIKDVNVAVVIGNELAI